MANNDEDSLKEAQEDEVLALMSIYENCFTDLRSLDVWKVRSW